MGTTKKPRKKYRPKPVLQNPVGYVLEGMTRVEQAANSEITLIKIKNHSAMVALLNGTAKKYEMNVLVAMSNIVEALWELGFGAEYQSVCVEGRFAIYHIVLRSQEHGKFTPTGSEITQLNMLLELHDAQMEVITMKDLENACALVRRRMNDPVNTVKLPPIPDHLK